MVAVERLFSFAPIRQVSGHEVLKPLSVVELK
jgi:hypothetical protein